MNALEEVMVIVARRAEMKYCLGCSLSIPNDRVEIAPTYMWHISCGGRVVNDCAAERN